MQTKRSASLCLLALALAVPTAAAAQPAPPAPPLPGVETETRFLGEVELLGAIAAGDDMDNVDTSGGLRLVGGVRLAPNLHGLVSLRVISVQFKDEPAGDISLAFVDFVVGGRLTAPVSPTLSVFGEGGLMYSTLSAEANGDSDSESDFGIELAAGGMLSLSPKLSLTGRIGYVKPFFEIDGVEIDFAWVTIGVGLSLGF